MDAAVHAPVGYLLHLADNALVLGQRNAEWCGHGPVLEEDIALTNISLDLIGQARLLYQHAASVQGEGATEDTLAYFRDAQQFRNCTLLELPHHGPLAGTAAADRDYATTIARNFLYSQLMVLLWGALAGSRDAQLAAIAAKSLKEVRYHLRHARDWLVRLGDGTDESHARMQAALDHLLPYTQEFFIASPDEAAAGADGTGVDTRSLQPDWDRAVDEALAEATLRRPTPGGHVPRGKQGQHSEHLGYLLAEMQSLARAHPGATW
ncbi:1,2-phenylacetyl-CoA epoxidase subunit PaaC [Ramlibacter tataouinensis]|uniref:Candidate Phenylacetic acid degradation protein n=1 Tax=Ramlibacter tataouinensis (strain ATCC BAA-407 / DSM 14655 / LMG 21543 / TTB310) TaxID=365046 RepID=F5XX16_RAMTT|nr:1,2-phenylacetyl-CoA epoxidase subunit PaaC [Ramlibacter tataouinensis]AEG91777.1 Candidate Phenylacetic acid degradation protein [Ramlibacter tataouinensis TTB310]